MSSFGIQNGNVNDRTFNAGGYGYEAAAWAVLPPVSHGPGWYLWDDQRALITNPYFVMCKQSSPTANSKDIFVKVTILSASERVQLDVYLWWNNSTHTGFINWASAQLITQSSSFAYYFRGGSDFMMLMARIGTSLTHFRLSGWEGIWNGTDGMQPESASGTLVNPAFLETDPGGYLSGYHNLTGFKPHLDGSGKLYFSIVNVSGSSYRIDIYSNSARTNLIGHTTSNFTNTATGAKNISQDNSSGLSGTITTDITVAAATNIDCRFNRLDLGSGEATNFIIGRGYFLIDMSQASPYVRFLKVEGISGDQLIVDSIGATPAAAGAYISPYPHRWVVSCSNSLAFGSFPNMLPYVPTQGSEFQPLSSSQNNSAGIDFMDAAMAAANPNAYNKFGLQRGWVFPNQSSVRDIFGRESNVRIGAGGSLNAFTDRRTVNGSPFLCFVAGGIASMVRDQEALS